MCAFDLVGNNTDRKSGHCLLGLDGRIQGIDHGLMFHQEFKLRTVIWEFGGEPVPDHLLEDIARLAADGLPDPLAQLLDPFERDAVLGRARAVVRGRRLPHRRDRPPLPLAPRLIDGLGARGRYSPSIPATRRLSRANGTTCSSRSNRRTCWRSSQVRNCVAGSGRLNR